MINSEKSGIAFSVHPVSQDEGQIFIEAGYGLGEAIVSGQITPDSYILNKNDLSIVEKKINKKIKGLYLSDEGKNEWVELDAKTSEKQVLEDNELAELGRIINKIEHHYGFPVDVEWAHEKGEFYIVQSRPITTLKKKMENKSKKFFVLEEILDIFPFPVYDFMDIKRINNFLKERLNIKNEFSESLTIYENSLCSLIFKEEEFTALSKEMVDFFIKKPQDAKKLNFEIVEESMKFFEYSKNLLVKIESNLSVEELISLWYESYIHYSELHKYGWVHTLIDFKDNLFTKHLMEYLSNISKDVKINLNEAFVTLTTPVNKETNFTKESKEFRLIERNAAMKIKNDPEIKAAIKEHCKKYNWMGFGFTGPSWTEEHFSGNLLERVNVDDGKDNYKEKQEKIINNLNIDKDHAILFELARQLIEGKEFRKESMLYYFYVLDKILEKISILTNIKKESLRLFYPNELHIFLGNRGKYHINHITSNMDTILTGDNAREHIKNFEFRQLFTTVSSLTGSVAYPGYATGIAKIINIKEDIKKIQQGDILISIATNPDLVPAMKKAAAIVTDVGGITSHAAIISRELQIPCVIGTSVATKAIKDGDKVEVDADNGIIRILESK
jgi:pyruvate,water dikinase